VQRQEKNEATAPAPTILNFLHTLLPVFRMPRATVEADTAQDSSPGWEPQWGRQKEDEARSSEEANKVDAETSHAGSGGNADAGFY
jgi:hypothetical protein